MTLAFTSWTALKTAILDAVADGSILTKSYSIDGRTHVMRDASDIKALLQMCDEQIAAEGSGFVRNLATFGRPS